MGELTNAPPAITVVIPCFNLGRFLEEAVQSALAQTMQDFEVIIVDDGSTDEATRTLLESYDRPKTRVVRRTNHGLAATRNYGIREARGRYICCLDADDRIRPEFFAKALEILEQEPRVGFVTGHFQMFGEQDDFVRLGRAAEEITVSSCSLPALLVENRTAVPALFRRDVWAEVGGYCETFSFSGFEDWDLWISILEAGYRAEVIPEVIWDYRIHPEQMSTTMHEPRVWHRLNWELVERHRATYERYLVEVVAEHGLRWATIRQWANDREKARAWWEGQATTWQGLAEQREQLLLEQKAWISDLERAKAWLEEQREGWQRRAEEAEKALGEQHGDSPPDESTRTDADD